MVILGHHNADPDAVGAAQGVKELIENLKPDANIHVVMPDDISKLSRQIIESLELEVYEKYSGYFDTIVAVDSGGLNQLGEWGEVIKAHQQVIVVIDHHTLDDELSHCTDLLIYNTVVAPRLLFRRYNRMTINDHLMTTNDHYFYPPTIAFFNFQTLKPQTPVKQLNDHGMTI